MATLLGAQGFSLAFWKTDWCQDKLTRRTGNLPRNCCIIIVENGVNHQSIKVLKVTLLCGIFSVKWIGVGQARASIIEVGL